MNLIRIVMVGALCLFVTSRIYLAAEQVTAKTPELATPHLKPTGPGNPGQKTSSSSPLTGTPNLPRI